MQQFEHNITLAGKKARYYQLSDTETETNSNKPVAHFYGGNGFPAGVYEPLLSQLSQQYNVISLAMRGYWLDLPKAKVMTREQDAEMLIEFLDKTQSGPVIGIGHSQGATATAIAAAKRPDLFSALYLIDPVTFTKSRVMLFKRIPRKLLLTREPFKSTSVKRTEWPSVEAHYESLRSKRAFRRISDENLKIYAKNSLLPNKDGSYTLLFKPDQELASYFGTPYVTPALKKLNKKRVPYLLILAKPSIYNSEKVRKSWKKIVSEENVITLHDYGHLLPLEAPQVCANVIFDYEQARVGATKS